MARVTLYTTVSCVFCARAKQYLRHRAIPYREIDVTEDETARARLVEASGGQRTVPQIFVGDVHLGGYLDLVRKLPSRATGQRRAGLLTPG